MKRLFLIVLSLALFSPFIKNSFGAGFESLNGVAWFYSSSEEIRFTSITARLDELYAQGVRVIGIYSPYHGNKHKWLGCDPLDFYDVSPANGRMQDFRELVSAAHARGMKVVSYFTNIFIDRKSKFFVDAQAQYARGDRNSPEVSAVSWSAKPKGTIGIAQKDEDDFEDPDGPEPKWLYSPVAKAWYWSIWGEVGFDFSLPGARSEVVRAMKFWLDTGLDGFMFDAGEVKESYRAVMVDVIKNHGGEKKWITFESTEGEKAASYDKFGLTSWFNLEDNDHVNDYSRVVRGQISMDELEMALRISDRARSLGKSTHAWAKASSDEDLRSGEEEEEAEEKKPYVNEPLMRVQEAALLAGAGILYGTPNISQLEQWPSQTREAWSRVLVAVNANASLLPSASRQRLKVLGAPARTFAMLRKSGAQKALLVFNFTPQPRAVLVSLEGAGLKNAQKPVDLVGKSSPALLSGSSYRVDLAPWGFAFLGVK